jgi:hypothetical protein
MLMNLQLLAYSLGKENEYLEITKQKGKPSYLAQASQLRLLEKHESYS